MHVIKEGEYAPKKNDDGALLITIGSDIREELEGVDPKWLAIEEAKKQHLVNPGLSTYGSTFVAGTEGEGKTKKSVFGRTFKMTPGIPGL